MRSINFFVTAGLLIGFPSLVGAVETTGIPVFPTAYKSANVPGNYAGGNYVNWPSTPGSIADISDSSLSTFTQVQGLDGSVDTGTFYLLQYQIDPNAASFSIDFTAKLDPYPFLPDGDFLIDVESPNYATVATVLWHVDALQPTTFGVEFFRDSNTGNFSSFSNWGLDSMLTPDGHLTIVLNGAFWAAVGQQGTVTSYLYDVNASYVVPEPGTICFLATAAIPPLLLRRRRSIVK